MRKLLFSLVFVIRRTPSMGSTGFQPVRGSFQLPRPGRMPGRAGWKPALPIFSRLSTGTFLLLAFYAMILLAPRAQAWGPMHHSITEAAFDSLPEWQRTVFAR